MLRKLFKPIRVFRARLAYDKAVEKCEENKDRINKRSYVIKGPRHNLMIITRDEFKGLKKNGYINHKANILSLEQNCFYCSSYPSGEGVLPEADRIRKRQECINWLSM